MRPKRCLLALHRKLRDIVASKLILDWSPEQISGWLKTQYLDDESLRVSHETISLLRCALAYGIESNPAESVSDLGQHVRLKRFLATRQTSYSVPIDAFAPFDR